MLNFDSAFISFRNCPLFIWSEAIVFFHVLCIWGSVQYHCGLAVLSVQPVVGLCDCHIVFFAFWTNKDR